MYSASRRLPKDAKSRIRAQLLKVKEDLEEAAKLTFWGPQELLACEQLVGASMGRLANIKRQLKNIPAAHPPAAGSNPTRAPKHQPKTRQAKGTRYTWNKATIIELPE